MSNFDNNMQVIVSKVVSDNQNAPTLRVNLEINGVKYKAGLWNWTRKDGSSVTDKDGNGQYKGKLEVDDFRPEGTQPSQPDYPAPELNDEIPF